MKTQSQFYAQMAQGVPPENGIYFSRFSDNEIEKIQKFVLKDTFNKSTKLFHNMSLQRRRRYSLS
jgi:hypothetical protein